MTGLTHLSFCIDAINSSRTNWPRSRHWYVKVEWCCMNTCFNIMLPPEADHLTCILLCAFIIASGLLVIAGAVSDFSLYLLVAASRRTGAVNYEQVCGYRVGRSRLQHVLMAGCTSAPNYLPVKWQQRFNPREPYLNRWHTSLLGSQRSCSR